MTSNSRFDMICAVAYAAERELSNQQGEKLPAWNQADAVTRQGLMDRVKFLQEHPDVGHSYFHSERLKRLKVDGWTYGKVYDENLKTDPTLVEFHRLPPSLQAKDRIFYGIVKELSRV